MSSFSEPSAGAGANAIAERAVVARGVRLATAVNTISRDAVRRTALAILPAAGFAWSAYRPILERFAPERRVAALDWPGFGASDRPSPATFDYSAVGYASLLGDWLNAVGGARVVLLGNGIGGSVALRFALAQPARVAGLVLVAPWGFQAGGFAARLRQLTLGSPWLRRRFERSISALALGPANAATRLILAAQRSEEASGATETARVAAALWRSRARDADLTEEALRTITAPTIVVRGALDPLVTAAETRRATLVIGPRGALEAVLPEAGHLPFLQQPQAFLRAVAGLFETIESR